MLKPMQGTLSAIKPLFSACPGAVYPRSVIEEFQHGTVLTEGQNAVILHHDCGFVFLHTNGSGFPEELAEYLLHPEQTKPHRAILFADDKTAAQFQDKPGFHVGTRFFFARTDTAPPAVSAAYPICEMTAELLRTVQGRIVPAFSWRSPEEFLRYGKAYCAVDHGKAVSWAFSAAVSTRETDIGVETLPEYRHNGLAAACAAALIADITAQRKQPVWACAAENTASAALAERLGFVRTAVCSTIQKGDFA